jgi:uncharacterized glyoxalase superfamily protein PhnB
MTDLRFGYTVMWVKDAARSAEFYGNAFGLRERTRMQTHLTPWIEMETGATTIAFAEYGEADVLFQGMYRALDSKELPSAILLSFVTSDVAGVFAAAIKAGATVIDEPRTEPWGQTIARIRDLNGVLVSLASPFSPPVQP